MLKQPRYHFARDLAPNHDCEVRAQHFRRLRLAKIAERERQKRITHNVVRFLGAVMLAPQAMLFAYAVMH